MSGMAKTTSDLILGVIRKFELMLTRRAVNMLGEGLRSPSALLVIEISLSSRSTCALRCRWFLLWSLRRPLLAPGDVQLLRTMRPCRQRLFDALRLWNVLEKWRIRAGLWKHVSTLISCLHDEVYTMKQTW